MRVRCVVRDPRQVASGEVAARLLTAYKIDGPDESLTVGSEYAVHALERWADGGLRVYLRTSVDQSVPSPYPIELFEVSDGALPSDWYIALGATDAGQDVVRIAFHDWATDERFYERLIAGDPAALLALSRRGAT